MLGDFFITLLTTKCIKTDKRELYHYLVSAQTKQIDFRVVGLSLVEQENIELLEEFKLHFINDDLDYFLSKSNANQTKLNLALLQMGAKVNSKYLNRSTTSKVNHILEFLLKKGDTK